MTQLPPKQKPFYVRWLSICQCRQPRWLAFAELCAFQLLIGWVDYVTGWEWSLFVLYALPIILAVQLGGFLSGLGMAGLSAGIWWLANLQCNPYHTNTGYLIAMTSRFFYFAVAAVAAAALRKRRASDAAQIRMLEEQRRLENEIVRLIEHEQQRIGRDLHDGLCQQLAAIGCALRTLADELGFKQNITAEDITPIEEMIRNAIAEARRITQGILPVHLDRLGLAMALSELARDMTRVTNISVRLVETGDMVTPPLDTATHLYRIAQEAVANAARHSGAKEIAICLRENKGELDMRIEDDGAGIKDSAVAQSPGLGLRTMLFRAQAIGAELVVKTRPGGGTVVSCKLAVKTPSNTGSTDVKT